MKLKLILQLKFLFSLAFILILFNSCNYNLFVKKENTIYDKTGYLISIGPLIIFSECGNSGYDFMVVSDNLNKKNNNFYLPGVSNTTANKYKASGKYQIVNFFDDLTGTKINDTIFYTFVRVRAIPYRSEVHNFNHILNYSYENNNCKLHYSTFKNEIISMMIEKAP